MPRNDRAQTLEDAPLWYKEAVIYEVHVRAFYDSDGDGVGDFAGLTSKLDYLQDLGVTAIWLLPFYPSPLRDDGYDIADPTAVNPTYGTLRDFQTFLREAHRRGLRVITELVLNHTSDQHPWFQRARRAQPGSRHRGFYVWSDTPDKWQDARIIFRDFETSNWAWDPVAKAYYWHRFYSHQPDLNYDSADVRRAMLQVVDFWFNLGVDGLRLDAVPYLYEREGTSCENLEETHAFLKTLRAHVDRKFKNRMLLAEANQWPSDAVAYFGEGDECHMAFHFPLMPRMFMALRVESRFPIIEILQQTPQIPDASQWALFLRNHDELTLEMVTDEERDYMYRIYANDPQARINLGIRRRLAPLLGNNRRRIELMNGLLFSLPGSQVLYYGDEIGMGDNIYLGDRNGVRTPMQWSGDRNAGFSRANPQKLFLPVIIDPEYHYETVNVEAEQSNPSSLLWWMKRLIALRKRYQAFSRGSIEFLYPENHKVLAFLRRYGDQQVLVVANLSRFVQAAELDLTAYRGMVPVELFGRTKFPPVGDLPYFLTLGPHSFYWFALEPQAVPLTAPVRPPSLEDIPALAVAGAWESAVQGRSKPALEEALPNYLRTQRWFDAKSRTIQTAQILDAVPVPSVAPAALVTLVEVRYTEGDPDVYALPLAFAEGERAEQAREAGTVVARLRAAGRSGPADGVLYDAFSDKDFLALLPEAMARRRRFRGAGGEIQASPTRAMGAPLNAGDAAALLSPRKGEQSNSSTVFGDRFLLKMYRRLHRGLNPDLEIGRFLTERTAFEHVPPVAGALEYRPREGEPVTLGMLQRYVPNEGDAWSSTMDALGSYFDRVLTREGAAGPAPLSRKALLLLAGEETPGEAAELIGPYLEVARLLGRRTAELHLALASHPEDPGFAPEPMTEMYRRGLHHSMTGQAEHALQMLRQRLRDLPQEVQSGALRLLDLAPAVRRRFEPLRDRRISAQRIRCHGDFHLGQVLDTGRDFVIRDFEGEPARPLSERRIKRSPLSDVAGMLRSFQYASHAGLLDQVAGMRSEDRPALEGWALSWRQWVSAAYVQSYLAAVSPANLLPPAPAEVQLLLDAFLLEKAMYELLYELGNRPEWVQIPIDSIIQMVQTGE